MGFCYSIDLLFVEKYEWFTDFKGVQPTRQNRLDPTQLAELGQFLGFDGLGWVTKFFFIRVGLGLGHKIPNPPNTTRPTHIFSVYIYYN